MEVTVAGFQYLETIVNLTMGLFQIQDLVQPVHQQRFSIDTLGFDGADHRRRPAWPQPVQGTHGSSGILQQFRKIPALHAESAIGGVLDFLKAHRDLEN